MMGTGSRSRHPGLGTITWRYARYESARWRVSHDGDRVKIQAPRSGDHHMEICEIRVGKMEGKS